MRRLSVLCSFLCILGTEAAAQTTAQLDAVVQPYAASKAFMGAALVVRGGEILLDKGYGSANLEWDIPNTPVTKFRLGSLTKQFNSSRLRTRTSKKELRPSRSSDCRRSAAILTN